MSENPADPVVKKEIPPNPALPDWYLQNLVEIVNGKEFEFPITLFVGGLMVTG